MEMFLNIFGKVADNIGFLPTFLFSIFLLAVLILLILRLFRINKALSYTPLGRFSSYSKRFQFIFVVLTISLSGYFIYHDPITMNRIAKIAKAGPKGDKEIIIAAKREGVVESCVRENKGHLNLVINNETYKVSMLVNNCTLIRDLIGENVTFYSTSDNIIAKISSPSRKHDIKATNFSPKQVKYK